MQVHDRELALKRAAGKAELAAELHQMLVQSCIELQALIQQAWQDGQRDALLTHVHKLNGSTRYCGVPELEARAEQLETALKREVEDLQEGYDTLLAALQRVVVQRASFQD